MESTVAETLDIFQATPNINAWIFDRLRPWCGRRVLETGSGIGNLTEFLKTKDKVVATDVDQEFIDRLRTRFAGHPNVVVERLDLGAMDVPALQRHALDTVLSVNVLEHVEDDARALRDLHQIVAPGGHLLLYVPALPWLYGSIDRGLHHFRRYARGELRDKLTAAGWKVVHLSYMNLLGIPGWFLNSRVLKRSVLPVGPVALYDRLTPILRLEDHLPLPIGMSLVAIGERTPDPS
jgi:SAM-dependent methyltransferase